MEYSLTLNGGLPDEFGTVSLPFSGRDVSVEGWAIDTANETVFSSLIVQIGERVKFALYGLDRLEIAHHFRRYGYRYCGFRFSARLPEDTIYHGDELQLSLFFIERETGTRRTRYLRVRGARAP